MSSYTFNYKPDKLDMTVDGYFDHDAAGAWFEISTVKLGIHDISDVLSDDVLADIEKAAFKELANDAARGDYE